jgi:hypothetical protein
LLISILRAFFIVVAKPLPNIIKNTQKKYTFVTVYDANFKPTFEQRKTVA